MISAISKADLVISLIMLGVGVSALVARFAFPSVSDRTIVTFGRATNALFIAYLIATLQFYWLFIWVVLSSGFEFRRTRNFDRNLLVVVGLVLLLQGTVGTLDGFGIDWARPAVLITAVFLMLAALIWAAFVESKKEYPTQTEQTAPEQNHSGDMVNLVP